MAPGPTAPMTGRERLSAVLGRRPVDRLCWSTLADETSLSRFPPPHRGLSVPDFYRLIGCDMLFLNGYGTPHALRSPGLAWGPGVTMTRGGDGLESWTTPHGRLDRVFRNGHPIKALVTNADELRTYRRVWEDARFEAHDDGPAFADLEREIGDAGIATRFWGPTAIPRLLEFDVGLEAFYYLLADHPDEMRALIAAIHAQELEAFRILAAGPWDVLILCENTSTRYISPAVYEEFNGPHVKDFVDIVHAAGKTAIIHMCGHIRGLLPLIAATGLDGVHTLTPPPCGDTPWELALDVLGEDTIIIGALDPSIFVNGSPAQIAEALDALYTPRLRRAHTVLCPMADGIVVPLENFLAVGEWMRRHGRTPAPESAR